MPTRCLFDDNLVNKMLPGFSFLKKMRSLQFKSCKKQTMKNKTRKHYVTAKKEYQKKIQKNFIPSAIP